MFRLIIPDFRMVSLKTLFSATRRPLAVRSLHSQRMVTKLEDIPTLFDKHKVARKILSKVSLWRGDITKIEVDAIVNAANKNLTGGGGVDGAIHLAAGGKQLQAECRQIGSCAVGDAVVTSGCGITHIKKIIHTVGPALDYGRKEPTDEEENLLRSCYQKSMERLMENELRTIAFCCISTGIYGYPNEDAALMVGNFFCKFLKRHGDQIDRIVICVFLDADQEYYSYFFDEYTRLLLEREKKEKAEAKAALKAKKREEKAARVAGEQPGPNADDAEPSTSHDVPNGEEAEMEDLTSAVETAAVKADVMVEERKPEQAEEPKKDSP